MNGLPLASRVFKSSFGVQSVYSSLASEQRPPVYKNYDKENFQRACEAIVRKGTSIRMAALQYNIPKSTLSDHISGKVKIGAHSGPPRYLNDVEEEELSNFISQCASIGCAKTKKEVLCIVEAVLASKGLSRHISNGWWESFRRRHPEFSLRTAEKLSYSRLVVTDASIMNKYFDILERTLIENDLNDKPSQIFNCDETGLCLDHTPSKIVANKGQKHPRLVTSGNKKQITVLGCANAAGNVVPPLVIFGRKSLDSKLVVGEVPGTMYGLSDKGWMDSEIFENWFTHHFLLHAPSARPLLLLLDGHSSHYNPAFINRAAEEKVIVFCFPPYSTHITQALDKIFGPLKTHWNEECQDYMTKNPGKIVTQFDFNQVFSKAWYKGMTMRNVISAFQTTGVFPLSRSAIKTVDVAPKFNPSALAKKNGLAFIPLYSPMHSSKSVARCPSQHLPGQESFHMSCPNLSVEDSSMHSSAASSTPVQCSFSEEEHARFEWRYQEGFDITSDDRYNQWLKECKSTTNSQTSLPPNLLLNSHQPSVLKKFFPELPPQAVQSKKAYEKHSGKVLTSAEHRKAINEKERLKMEKQAEKERKKLEREKKRREKITAKDKGMCIPWVPSNKAILETSVAL